MRDAGAAPPSRASQLGREYLSGSLASSSTAAMFSPLEAVKTRLQLQDMPGWRRTYAAGFGRALLDITRQDGLLALWSYGFAGLVSRDFVYSGVRTGMYPTVRDAVAAAQGNAAGEASLVDKIAAGALCGAIGASIANPFDVVRVRMTAEGGVVADGLLATGMRAGHAPRWRSSAHCAADAVASEGLLRGLVLRGVGASMARAGLLTAAQMSTYDHTKTVAKRNGWLREGVALHVVGAVVSGLFATVACTPADVLKSRVMAGSTAGRPASTAAVALHILRHDGLRGFYRGFLVSWVRLGPTIFVQMPLAEALRSALGVRSL